MDRLKMTPTAAGNTGLPVEVTKNVARPLANARRECVSHARLMSRISLMRGSLRARFPLEVSTSMTPSSKWTSVEVRRRTSPVRSPEAVHQAEERDGLPFPRR